jgi:hypothetical protein
VGGIYGKSQEENMQMVPASVKHVAVFQIPVFPSGPMIYSETKFLPPTDFATFRTSLPLSD